MKGKERFKRLENALKGMPPDYRKVIELSRIEGLRISEIAQLMGRSPAAISMLLMRALKKLREAFGDTDDFELSHSEV